METRTTETEKSPREIAQLFLDKWEVFASPLDALELLIKGRDERAAKIIKEHRESDRCEGSCWEIISSAIRGKSNGD